MNNDQLAETLQRLADRLGVTAEHLWGVLVRQAPTAAVSGFLQSAIPLALMAYVTWKMSKMLKDKLSQGPDPDGVHYMDDMMAISFCCIGIAAGLFALSLIVACTDWGLIWSGFFNPEYYALHEVLHW